MRNERFQRIKKVAKVSMSFISSETKVRSYR